MVRPATTAKMVAKATAEMKPSSRGPPMTNANSGAAAFYARLGFRPLPSGSEQAPRVGISTAAEL